MGGRLLVVFVILLASLRMRIVRTALTDGCSARQKQENARTMRERNVQNCLDECSECNPGLLTDAERRETVRAVHIRSWRNCLEGLGDCSGYS